MTNREKRPLLVVDDEINILHSLYDLFRLDYRVYTARSGPEALRVLEENEVHVVMADQRMPEMTGVEFLAQMKEQYPDIIRLVFTGYADVRAVVDAINQGNVYRYITKPWEPEELKSIISQAMEQYQLLIDRRRLMQELKEANSSLKMANDDLQRAYRELKELDRLKSVFIDIASHELRTPVFVISGFARLLARQSAKPPKELKSILESADRLGAIVVNMAKLMEAREWHHVLDTKPVAAAELIDKSLGQVQPFIEIRHQHLDIKIEQNLPMLEVEPPMIIDAIVNLLTNAIKFTPDEGHITIHARSSKTEPFVEISVSDTGVGIPPEELPYIFTEFFGTFDTSHHSSGEYEFGRRGIGLGLSVVRKFVEIHGGKVSVKSKVGEGSTFTITVPTKHPDKE
ncbi:MAG TPA: hybrid sensor histidine kinase/response regulator [Planctomycetota bacterium]|nr:hybrid sensor histidine kinase/response regulator [Planctomycetota bacterium]